MTRRALPIRPMPARLLSAGRWGIALAGCAALSACQPFGKPARPAAAPPSPVTGSGAWAAMATDGDITRLGDIDREFAAGLKEAGNAGFRAAIQREGDLLDPRAALANPAPTPGSYYCRTVTLGKTKQRGSPAFQRFKSFFCYIDAEGDHFTMVKQTGTDRPSGRIYPDPGTRRLVFLGAMTRGGEKKIAAYGDDPRRDIVGTFERIGPFRWRLLMPQPADGGRIDITEFIPVVDTPA